MTIGCSVSDSIFEIDARILLAFLGVLVRALGLATRPSCAMEEALRSHPRDFGRTPENDTLNTFLKV